MPFFTRYLIFNFSALFGVLIEALDILVEKTMRACSYITHAKIQTLNSLVHFGPPLSCVRTNKFLYPRCKIKLTSVSIRIYVTVGYYFSFVCGLIVLTVMFRLNKIASR